MKFRTITLKPSDSSLVGKYRPDESVFAICDATDDPFTVSLPNPTKAEGLFVFYNDSAQNVTVDEFDLAPGEAQAFLHSDDEQFWYPLFDFYTKQEVDDLLENYLYIPGRSGGQIAYGGTGASENLTLEATAHATAGEVRLAPNGGKVVVGGGAEYPETPQHLMLAYDRTGNRQLVMLCDFYGKLEVFPTGPQVTFKQRAANGATDQEMLVILSGNGYTPYSRIGHVYYQDTTRKGHLYFDHHTGRFTWSADGGGTTQISLDSAGRLIIGDETAAGSPLAQLDVRGDASVLLTDSGTSDIVTVHTLTRGSSGTTAAGFGLSRIIKLQNNIGSFSRAAEEAFFFEKNNVYGLDVSTAYRRTLFSGADTFYHTQHGIGIGVSPTFAGAYSKHVRVAQAAGSSSYYPCFMGEIYTNVFAAPAIYLKTTASPYVGSFAATVHGHHLGSFIVMGSGAAAFINAFEMRVRQNGSASLYAPADCLFETYGATAKNYGQLVLKADGTTRIGTGDGSNYSSFETDGTLVFNGNATVFDDLNFDPTRSGGPAATRPDDVTINNVIHKEFTSSNNQLCGAVEELPHQYKLSSTIYPHIHIFLKSGESAGTTGVTFTFYWELRQTTGTTSGSVTLSATSAQLTASGAHKFNIYDATGFAGAAELGGQLACTIARTAGDAGDIVVTTYGVHYEIDTVGSRTLSSK